MFEFNNCENEYLNKLDNLFDNAENFEQKIQILSMRKEFIEKMQEFELKWLSNQLEFRKQNDQYSLQRYHKLNQNSD
ncbi:hypothetical protein [Aggregatibacter actinomycetemcomitans]|uniref:hypothetical protein n=1 Tax=Aggregatibacter actinomycetemcomitans TaxID=714 RepID=UPI00197BF755|nr:hypothetical protein [Aggregatibacter actinomycetemcomitans]MBN6063511.1 hypothetical protein [Aggregatibacter actinomycetemcomitans]MBN6083394.1 hypothetical protein [Aggregatibacter actinomycetemcomitans]